MIGKEMFYII